MPNTIILNIDGKERDIVDDEVGFSDKGGPEIDDIPFDGMGWDDEVVRTLSKWINKMEDQYIIYSILQNGLIETAEKYNISSLVCSGILTLINILKYILETKGDAEKAFSILIAVVSFLTFILTGLSKIKNVPARIQSNAAYLSDVHRFVETINIEKQKPVDLRRNAGQFINAMSEFRTQIAAALPEMNYKEKVACLKIKRNTKKELTMTRTGSVPTALIRN